MKKRKLPFVPKLKERPAGMPLEIARIIQGICKDRRDAAKLELECEVCMSEATGKCAGDRHWVCDDCTMFHRCGCSNA